MQALMDQLALSLTGKNSPGDCSVDELEQLIRLYPYFPLTRLLLAENKGQVNASDNHLSLYFSNSLWLDQWLNNKGDAVIVPAVKDALPEEQISMLEEPVSIVKEETEEIREDEPVPEKFSAEKDFQIPGLKIEPLDPAKSNLVFEPFYTVDYFASQGIKPAETEKPVDHFGRQLKSFTDWLKVMKRLPVAELEKVTDPKAELKVEQLAEHSLEEKEVLTEAMAAVWEKQGNRVKAASIYAKLSLLDPAKSTYFAAKIEELKKSN